MSESKLHNRPLGFERHSEFGKSASGSLTTERWLSSSDAADILGISVGALTMRVYRGEIKPRKLGRLNRFSSIEIEKLLQIPSETSVKRRF